MLETLTLLQKVGDGGNTLTGKVYTKEYADTLLAAKQDKLIGGTNISKIFGLDIMDIATNPAISARSSIEQDNKTLPVTGEAVFNALEKKLDVTKAAESYANLSDFKKANGCAKLFKATDSAGADSVTIPYETLEAYAVVVISGTADSALFSITCSASDLASGSVLSALAISGDYLETAMLKYTSDDGLLSVSNTGSIIKLRTMESLGTSTVKIKSVYGFLESSDSSAAA